MYSSQYCINNLDWFEYNFLSQLIFLSLFLQSLSSSSTLFHRCRSISMGLLCSYAYIPSISNWHVVWVSWCNHILLLIVHILRKVLSRIITQYTHICQIQSRNHPVTHLSCSQDDWNAEKSKQPTNAIKWIWI